MTEARIECTCTTYNLPGLGLALRRGDVEWLDEATAKASGELALARRAGAVSVRYEERCAVSRSPVPPFLRRRPAVPPFAAPVAAPVDHQAVAEAMRDVVRQEIQEALRGLSGSTVDHAAVADTVRKAVSEGIQQGGGTSTSRGGGRAPVVPEVAGDAPVFIPSQITGQDTKSDVRVTTETSGSTDVEDAAALLKAARASSRKKKTE